MNIVITHGRHITPWGGTKVEPKAKVSDSIMQMRFRQLKRYYERTNKARTKRITDLESVEGTLPDHQVSSTILIIKDSLLYLSQDLCYFRQSALYKNTNRQNPIITTIIVIIGNYR